MTNLTTYPLRLPQSLKAAAVQISAEDGTSLNQFAVMAIAEKISAMKTAEFFAERRQRADLKAFDKILNRKTSAPPREDDKIND